MRTSVKRVTLTLTAILFSLVLFGCTDWQKKYKSLNVEHENLKGLYDNCVSSLDTCTADKQSMSAELASARTQLEDLRMQIEDMEQPADQATGFEGMDVQFDPQKGTITVTLENTILFAPGKANLKSATVAELDQIRSVLRQRYQGREVDVVGHTDSDPIRKSQWKDNWELSAQRALSVLRYMVDHGMQGSQIRAVAAGETRPVASNTSATGKAKNRRVEIVVHMM